MANLFLVPPITISGKGALAKSVEHLNRLGKKPLIVTDEMMVKLGTTNRLTDVLKQAEMNYVIFSGINHEPDDTMIEEGIAIYKEENCDCLIAIGGGSPIDAMKAIGAVISNGGRIGDYYGKMIERPLPPTCAIPTTSGTGSEATQFTIISNTASQVKMLLKGPALMCRLAIIDPVLMLTAPPNVTAATGIDALCHAIEAYTSRKAFALADTVALSAVKRIFGYLEICYRNGSDLEAREQMSLAAYEAGMAFNNSSVTLIHGMSRPIGALYHVPHGLSNAMLLDRCLRFAVSGCPARFEELAKTVGVYKEGMSTDEGATAFIKAVGDLCERLQILSLFEFGVDKEDFFSKIEKMTEDAIASGSPENTWKRPSKEEMIAIYQSLF